MYLRRCIGGRITSTNFSGFSSFCRYGDTKDEPRTPKGPENSGSHRSEAGFGGATGLLKGSRRWTSTGVSAKVVSGDGKLASTELADVPEHGGPKGEMARELGMHSDKDVAVLGGRRGSPLSETIADFDRSRTESNALTNVSKLSPTNALATFQKAVLDMQARLSPAPASTPQGGGPASSPSDTSAKPQSSPLSPGHPPEIPSQPAYEELSSLISQLRSTYFAVKRAHLVSNIPRKLQATCIDTCGTAFDTLLLSFRTRGQARTPSAQSSIDASSGKGSMEPLLRSRIRNFHRCRALVLQIGSNLQNISSLVEIRSTFSPGVLRHLLRAEAFVRPVASARHLPPVHLIPHKSINKAVKYAKLLSAPQFGTELVLLLAILVERREWERVNQVWDVCDTATRVEILNVPAGPGAAERVGNVKVILGLVKALCVSSVDGMRELAKSGDGVVIPGRVKDIVTLFTEQLRQHAPPPPPPPLLQPADIPRSSRSSRYSRSTALASLPSAREVHSRFIRTFFGLLSIDRQSSRSGSSVPSGAKRSTPPGSLASLDPWLAHEAGHLAQAYARRDSNPFAVNLVMSSTTSGNYSKIEGAPVPVPVRGRRLVSGICKTLGQGAQKGDLWTALSLLALAEMLDLRKDTDGSRACFAAAWDVWCSYLDTNDRLEGGIFSQWITASFGRLAVRAESGVEGKFLDAAVSFVGLERLVEVAPLKTSEAFPEQPASGRLPVASVRDPDRAGWLSYLLTSGLQSRRVDVVARCLMDDHLPLEEICGRHREFDELAKSLQPDPRAELVRRIGVALAVKVRRPSEEPQPNGREIGLFALFLLREKQEVAAAILVRPFSSLIPQSFMVHVLKELVARRQPRLAQDVFNSIPPDLRQQEHYNALLRSNDRPTMRSAWDFVQRDDPDSLQLTGFNARMARLAETRNLKTVLATFEEMKKKRISPTRETYNILIHAFVRVRMFRGAFNIVRRMKRRKVRPDSVTFNTILRGLLLPNTRAEGRGFKQIRKVLSWLGILSKDPSFRFDGVTLNIIMKSILRWREIGSEDIRLFTRVALGTIRNGGGRNGGMRKGNIGFKKDVEPLCRMILIAFQARGDWTSAQEVARALGKARRLFREEQETRRG